MTSMLGSTKEEVTCLKVVTINLNPYTRTVRIITTSMSKGKNLIIEAKVTDISLYKNFLYFTTLSSMGQKKVLISKLTSVNYDSTNRITSRPFYALHMGKTQSHVIKSMNHMQLQCNTFRYFSATRKSFIQTEKSCTQHVVHTYSYKLIIIILFILCF